MRSTAAVWSETIMQLSEMNSCYGVSSSSSSSKSSSPLVLMLTPVDLHLCTSHCIYVVSYPVIIECQRFAARPIDHRHRCIGRSCCSILLLLLTFFTAAAAVEDAVGLDRSNGLCIMCDKTRSMRQKTGEKLPFSLEPWVTFRTDSGYDVVDSADEWLRHDNSIWMCGMWYVTKTD